MNKYLVLFLFGIICLALSAATSGPFPNHPEYATKEQFHDHISKNKEVYVIVSAEWCPPCKRLKKSLDALKLLEKVVIINLDDPWVRELTEKNNFIGLPHLIVYNQGRALINMDGLQVVLSYLISVNK